MEKFGSEGIDIDSLVKSVNETLEKIEQSLFGWRIYAGKKFIDCASEAKYLQIWQSFGPEEMKTT